VNIPSQDYPKAMNGPLWMWIMPVLGYLIGSFPTGVVLSRGRYGIDIREMGSGNIGTTNITRNFGWFAGFLTFAVDFFKGYLPILFLTQHFSDYPWLIAISAFATVLGHCSSVFLNFKGGKGVSTSLGCLLATCPGAAIVAAVVYLLLLIFVKISAIGSLGGFTAAVLYSLVFPSIFPYQALTWSLALLIWVCHESNIKRLYREYKKK